MYRHVRQDENGRERWLEVISKVSCSNEGAYDRLIIIWSILGARARAAPACRVDEVFHASPRALRQKMRLLNDVQC